MFLLKFHPVTRLHAGGRCFIVFVCFPDKQSIRIKEVKCKATTDVDSNPRPHVQTSFCPRCVLHSFGSLIILIWLRHRPSGAGGPKPEPIFEVTLGAITLGRRWRVALHLN